MVLEKVLGVAKSSHVGVDADEISYPLRHPTACRCRPDALSLWFGKVFFTWLPSLPLEESLP
jgi:hypothetical protein